MEGIILNPKFKEIEALIFQYMIDTTTINLGHRWKTEEQINSIRIWEKNKSLSNKLSSNYDTALRIIIFRKLVDVSSVTSYGNPREYKLKDEYVNQLFNLSNEAQVVLDIVIMNNPQMDSELPFT